MRLYAQRLFNVVETRCSRLLLFSFASLSLFSRLLLFLFASLSLSPFRASFSFFSSSSLFPFRVSFLFILLTFSLSFTLCMPPFSAAAFSIFLPRFSKFNFNINRSETHSMRLYAQRLFNVVETRCSRLLLVYLFLVFFFIHPFRAPHAFLQYSFYYTLKFWCFDFRSV